MQADTSAAGTFSGLMSFRSYGANAVNLSSTVGATAPKYTFAPTSRAFTCAGDAAEQTTTVTVTNNGDAAGTPDIVLTQAQQWFSLSYTPASLNPGANFTITIKFKPSDCDGQFGLPGDCGRY